MMARELANQPRQSPTEIEIKKRLGEIAELHPQGKSDRVKQQLYHALTQSVTKNPQLGQCDPNTIIIAACQAVALGLDLNPVLGEAYLVPRWNNAIRANECCFQPGYQGLVKLVRKAGQVVSIRAAIVHEGDTFRYSYTPDLVFEHIPKMQHRGSIANGKGVKAVYAIAKLSNGEMVIEVMTVDEIEEIRKVSKSAQNGPWVSFWGEMSKKTVLRRLIKGLPKYESEEGDLLAKALEYNDADYEDFSPKRIDNGTGHGSGKYASPEQSRAYLDALEKYVAKRNDDWEKQWVDDATGEIADGVRDLASTWEADSHLVRWCVDTDRLDPSIDPDNLKHNQMGRFAAIVYHRGDDRADMKKELRRFFDQKEAEKLQVVKKKNPHLFEEETTSNDVVDDGFDDLTEDNFIQEEAKEPEPVVTPPSPKPDLKKKPQQKTLVASDDPEVWPDGRE
jgi:recombination protein RecT